MCLEKIQTKTIEQCSSKNSLVVDKKLKETRDRVVFLGFKHFDGMLYYYHMDGSTKGLEEEHSRNVTKYNYEYTLTKIYDDLKELYGNEKVVVYVTVNPGSIRNFYFDEKEMNNLIDLLIAGLKEMNGFSLIFKYYPHSYLKYLNRKNKKRESETKALTLVNNKTSYKVFLDSNFFDTLFYQLDPIIKRHERKLIDNLKVKYKLVEKKFSYLYVILILDTIKESVEDIISISEAKIILKIWKFLKNKKEFYHTFIEIFSKDKTRFEDLKEIFKETLNNNTDYLKREGLIDIVQNNDITTSPTDWYLYINNLSKEDLNDYNRRFILKLFSAMLQGSFDSLVKIVFSENCININEVSNIRYELFESYKVFIKEATSDFISYLESKDIQQIENEFYGNLSHKCLKNILKCDNDDICVLKELNNKHFEEYARKTVS